ncbi:MAG: acyltransferase [Chitinophagales bacterium]
MLNKVLNKYISGLKGNNYTIDARVPQRYLVQLIWEKIFMKCRGWFKGLHCANTPFVGRKVIVKAKSKFRAGLNLTIGRNVLIDALSVDGITLGDNVSIGRNTIIECTGNLRWLGKGLWVGKNVGMGTDNFFGCAGGIEIGDDTIIGNFVSFHSENHNHESTEIPIRLQGVSHKGIKIGKDCWIGAKATILDGVQLEDGCIIGAGAVVRAGLYQAGGVYAGVPAKLIKFRRSS